MICPEGHSTRNRLRSPTLIQCLKMGLLVALYVVTAKFGLTLDPVGGLATAVWPPTGISLAALYLFGNRLWPGVAIGALMVNVSAGAPFLAACGMATGNTLEALLGSHLLQRFVDFPRFLDRIQGVVRFVLLAACVSTSVSALVGVTSGWLGGSIPTESLARAFSTWWLGDAMGDLLVVPLLLTWIGSPRMNLSPRRQLEVACLSVSVLIVSLVVFGAIPAPHGTIPLWPYLIFPFLIWAALRFGRHGAASATFVVTGIAIAMTRQGLGPFARGSLNESLLLLQLFMGVVALTMLVLAASIAERETAQGELRKTQEELERRVERRTAQLSESNLVLQEEMAERMHAENSLRDLSTRLLRIQDEERQRLARELHDSTAQGLAALSMNLAVVRGGSGSLDERAREALEETEILADQCSMEIRSLSYLLHPPLLKDMGLCAALRWCAEGFARHSGISVDLDLPDNLRRLSPEVENALFRIVQECLNNVQRHSGSMTAGIRLERTNQGVFLEVRDSGCGISPEILSRRDGVASLGVGLLGMRERVRQLGGRFRIDSRGGGAKVQVEIDLPQEGA